MKRIVTLFSLLLVALWLTPAAQAQSCETSLAAARLRTEVEARMGSVALLPKAVREQRIDALDARLPADGPTRCVLLAGMNLLPQERLVSADGELTSIVEQYWVAGAWQDSSRFLLSYSDATLPVEVIAQRWADTDWVNEFRSEFVFEGENQASFLFQEWDGTDWVNNSRGEATFDGNGRETMTLAQVWEAGAWVNLSQSETTYDDGSNESVTTSQFWSEEAWVNSSRTTTKLDDQDREVESTSEFWDEDAEEWMVTNTTQTVWANDGSSSVATSGFSLGEMFFASSRVTITYDGAGRETERIDELADFQTGDFTPFGRIAYTYDGAGNNTEVLFQGWDGAEWVNEELETNTFDGDNDIRESLGQTWNGAGWENELRSLYNYGTSTAREDLAGFGVSGIDLFPNPVRDRLTVDVTLDAPGYLRVDVYDLLGRRVATLADGPAPAGVRQLGWTPGDQPAGLYLVRLEAGGQARTHAVTLVR